MIAQEVIILILFVFAGYAIQRLWSGKYEGDRLKRSLRFLIGNYYIHIHHWLYSLAILVILYFFNIYHPVIYGLLIGFIIQGFTYRDRFIFYYHKDKFDTIYRKWKPVIKN
ncbi:hypothetical protein MYX07_00950 [Patescibacteria group bacterium AH-259-L07]|nr:hypothetical protein [Patescibacteria group bacterium AH-259-L07]